MNAHSTYEIGGKGTGKGFIAVIHFFFKSLTIHVGTWWSESWRARQMVMRTVTDVPDKGIILETDSSLIFEIYNIACLICIVC